MKGNDLSKTYLLRLTMTKLGIPCLYRVLTRYLNEDKWGNHDRGQSTIFGLNKGKMNDQRIPIICTQYGLSFKPSMVNHLGKVCVVQPNYLMMN